VLEIEVSFLERAALKDGVFQQYFLTMYELMSSEDRPALRARVDTAAVGRPISIER
jgi:hypothetical protein